MPSMFATQNLYHIHAGWKTLAHHTVKFTNNTFCFHIISVCTESASPTRMKSTKKNCPLPLSKCHIWNIYVSYTYGCCCIFHCSQNALLIFHPWKLDWQLWIHNWCIFSRRMNVLQCRVDTRKNIQISKRIELNEIYIYEKP